MNIVVDPAVRVTLIQEKDITVEPTGPQNTASLQRPRIQIKKERRFYYQVEGYPNLLLVTKNKPFEQLRGYKLSSLWRFKNDSRLVLEALPKAPPEWAEMKIIQVTLAYHKSPGRPKPLSEIIKWKMENLENYGDRDY